MVHAGNIQSLISFHLKTRKVFLLVWFMIEISKELGDALSTFFEISKLFSPFSLFSSSWFEKKKKPKHNSFVIFLMNFYYFQKFDTWTPRMFLLSTYQGNIGVSVAWQWRKWGCMGAASAVSTLLIVAMFLSSFTTTCTRNIENSEHLRQKNSLSFAWLAASDGHFT